jgi:Spy/CpxP family protein refolding chaperone
VKQIDLRDLLAADKPDRAALDRQLQAISASRLAMDKSRIDFRLNMKDALTPEQREKLRQAMKDRMQARRGEGRRGGPGGRGRRGPGGGGAGAAAPPATNPGE